MSGFINGALALDENVYITTSGDNNDIVITSSLLYASTTNNMDAITGIDPGVASGFFLILANIDASNSLVLKNNSSSSAAANRIITTTGADVIVLPYMTAMLGYDSMTLQWHLIDTVRACDKRQETYSGTTNASGVYTVTFATPYSVAPNIQANIVNQSNTNQFLRVTSVSTTGFTVNAFARASISVLGLDLLAFATTNVNGAAIDVLITEK